MSIGGRTGHEFPFVPRPHQAAVFAKIGTPAGRFTLVLPPGAGKTFIGSELARRAGRKTVVFVPNTTVQTQWVRLWETLPNVTVTTDRDVTADVLVLTYQSVAVQNGDGTQTLHPNAAGFVHTLGGTQNGVTVLLDEAHHLTKTWGTVIETILTGCVTPPVVIGLTATPPVSSPVVNRVAGEVAFTVPVSVLVKSGDLAPHRELVFFTELTNEEEQYLGVCDARWVKFTDEISVSSSKFSFPVWAAANNVTVPVSPGDRAWVGLLDGYSKWLLSDVVNAPAGVVAVFKTGARVCGFTATVNGFRPAAGAGVRVFAGSDSKAGGVITVTRSESSARGEDLRVLVLTDYETVTPTPGFAGNGYGSALRVLSTAAGDNVVGRLNPVMVTGQQVVMSRTVGDNFLRWAHGHTSADIVDDAKVEECENDPDFVAFLPAGRWGPKTWVPLLTEWFQIGGTRFLVGTRGLFGEGWDADKVNVLFDLCTATTPAMVTQIRGRAVRKSDKGKVANIWNIVTVSDGHGDGWTDFQRFSRKQNQILNVTAGGNFVTGVKGVDSGLVSDVPPPRAGRVALNARMLRAGANFADTRLRWAADADVYKVTIPTAVGRRCGGLQGVGEIVTVVTAALRCCGADLRDVKVVPTEHGWVVVGKTFDRVWGERFTAAVEETFRPAVKGSLLVRKPANGAVFMVPLWFAEHPGKTVTFRESWSAAFAG
jgi:superfamily II DNA or RNA helicase